jgi:multiple antibiotic resistance protein
MIEPRTAVMLHNPQGLEAFVDAFLLGFPALFSVVNPIGGAFVFQTMLDRGSPARRAAIARRVSIYSCCVLLSALWAGSIVMDFFGVTLAALRVAGGTVIALNAWQLLSRPARQEPATSVNGDNIAFFPLTMPIIAGPGSISVAVALSSEHPRTLSAAGWFFGGMSVAVVGVSITIWLSFGAADRVTRLLGDNGNRILERLMAFMLLCIGVQILLAGVQDVLGPAATTKV